MRRAAVAAGEARGMNNRVRAKEEMRGAADRLDAA